MTGLTQSIESGRDQAHSLAARLPELLIEAKRVSNTVSHGIHGRRRAGPGETFWQFRTYQSGDAAAMIDWRRSASSDQLYLREREWEAAHTIWLWSDLSPSMDFASHLSAHPKRERALVLMLALGELLMRGGERVGLMGLSTPMTGRGAIDRLAETILQYSESESEGTSSSNNAAPTQDSAAPNMLFTGLPPQVRLSQNAECVLFSDFLEPIDQLKQRIDYLAGQGVRGHLVQILDPAEETLPYSGRIEFRMPERGQNILIGRAETIRDAYHKKLLRHREELRDHIRALQWSFLLHHSDQPAEQALLALHMHLAGLEKDYRSTAQNARNAANDSLSHKSASEDSSSHNSGEAAL